MEEINLTFYDYLVPANGVVALVTAIIVLARIRFFRLWKRPWMMLVPKTTVGIVLLFYGGLYMYAFLLGPTEGVPFINRHSPTLIRVPEFLLFIALAVDQLCELSVIRYARNNPSFRRIANTFRNAGDGVPSDPEK